LLDTRKKNKTQGNYSGFQGKNGPKERSKKGGMTNKRVKGVVQRHSGERGAS